MCVNLREGAGARQRFIIGEHIFDNVCNEGTYAREGFLRRRLEPAEGRELGAKTDEFFVFWRPDDGVSVAIGGQCRVCGQPRILWITKDAEEAATMAPSIIPTIHLVRRVSI